MTTMNTEQFQQIIAEIKSVKDALNGRMDHLDDRMDHLDGRMGHLDGRMGHLDGRIGRMDRRMNVMSGIYLAGLIFILTGVGVYTNIVLLAQNLK